MTILPTRHTVDPATSASGSHRGLRNHYDLADLMPPPTSHHPITAAATSIAAFVDVFAAGPFNTAVRIRTMADFDRQFGGLLAESEASYAIRQFFLNGGSDASVVRIAAPTAASLLGDSTAETGMFALVDAFNVLCLPL